MELCGYFLLGFVGCGRPWTKAEVPAFLCTFLCKSNNNIYGFINPKKIKIWKVNLKSMNLLVQR